MTGTGWTTISPCAFCYRTGNRSSKGLPSVHLPLRDCRTVLYPALLDIPTYRLLSYPSLTFDIAIPMPPTVLFGELAPAPSSSSFVISMTPTVPLSLGWSTVEEHLPSIDENKTIAESTGYDNTSFPEPTSRFSMSAMSPSPAAIQARNKLRRGLTVQRETLGKMHTRRLHHGRD